MSVSVVSSGLVEIRSDNIDSHHDVSSLLPISLGLTSIVVLNMITAMVLSSAVEAVCLTAFGISSPSDSLRILLASHSSLSL